MFFYIYGLRLHLEVCYMFFVHICSIVQVPPIAVQVTVEEKSKGGLRYHSFKFGKLDGIIVDRILQHMELLLQVSFFVCIHIM